METCWYVFILRVDVLQAQRTLVFWMSNTLVEKMTTVRQVSFRYSCHSLVTTSHLSGPRGQDQPVSHLKSMIGYLWHLPCRFVTGQHIRIILRGSMSSTALQLDYQTKSTDSQPIPSSQGFRDLDIPVTIVLKRRTNKIWSSRTTGGAVSQKL